MEKIDSGSIGEPPQNDRTNAGPLFLMCLTALMIGAFAPELLGEAYSKIRVATSAAALVGLTIAAIIKPELRRNQWLIVYWILFLLMLVADVHQALAP